jgi:thymidylate kinase
MALQLTIICEQTITTRKKDNMSLYILEGQRNTGKTTVAKSLNNAFGEGRVCTFKFARTSNPAIHMTRFLMRYDLALRDSRTICVIDRFHLTEFVMRKLDKKIGAEQLITTTSMIDTMLHQIGAITYVLQAEQGVRRTRFAHRDEKHRKPEWPNQTELDEAWTYAMENFHESRVKVMASNTQEDIDRIVIDIMKEQSKQTHLKEKWESTPPLPKASIPIHPVESEVVA